MAHMATKTKDARDRIADWGPLTAARAIAPRQHHGQHLGSAGADGRDRLVEEQQGAHWSGSVRVNPPDLRCRGARRWRREPADSDDGRREARYRAVRIQSSPASSD